MGWWNFFSNRTAEDPTYTIDQRQTRAWEIIAEEVSGFRGIYDLRMDLYRIEKENNDRYHNAYARSAEQYLEITKKQLAHQEYVMGELLRRWKDQVDKLQAEISELKERLKTQEEVEQ